MFFYAHTLSLFKTTIKKSDRKIYYTCNKNKVVCCSYRDYIITIAVFIIKTSMFPSIKHVECTLNFHMT